MQNTIDTIKNYIVKIEDKGIFCQSGILWVPDVESEVAYVFTVAHGIRENTALSICFWYGSTVYNLPVDNVLFHPDKNIDAAVLVMSHVKLPVSQYSLLSLDDLGVLLTKEAQLVQLRIFGYPKLRCSDSYRGQNQQYNFPCSIENLHQDEDFRTVLAFYGSEARLSVTDPEAQLVGISGGGVFVSIQDTVFLCGIYCGSPTSAVHYSELTLLSLQAIQEVSFYYSTHFPSFQPRIPTSLHRHLSHCLHDFGADHVLAGILQDVSACDFSEIICASCGKCNPCEYGNLFYLCDRFQQQFLKCCALLKYNNLFFDEHKALEVLKDGEHYEVRIICSDVYPSHIEDLINALKQDYLGKNKLSEDSLLLWATKEAYNHRSANCTRKEFQNIVGDISTSKSNYFDYSNVYEVPERIAITNVPYILNELGEDPNAFSDFIKRM